MGFILFLQKYYYYYLIEIFGAETRAGPGVVRSTQLCMILKKAEISHTALKGISGISGTDNARHGVHNAPQTSWRKLLAAFQFEWYIYKSADSNIK